MRLISREHTALILHLKWIKMWRWRRMKARGKLYSIIFLAGCIMTLHYVLKLFHSTWNSIRTHSKVKITTTTEEYWNGNNGIRNIQNQANDLNTWREYNMCCCIWVWNQLTRMLLHVKLGVLLNVYFYLSLYTMQTSHANDLLQLFPRSVSNRMKGFNKSYCFSKFYLKYELHTIITWSIKVWCSCKKKK